MMRTEAQCKAIAEFSAAMAAGAMADCARAVLARISTQHPEIDATMFRIAREVLGSGSDVVEQACFDAAFPETEDRDQDRAVDVACSHFESAVRRQIQLLLVDIEEWKRDE